MFEVSVVYLVRPPAAGRDAPTEVLLGEKLTGFGRGRLVGPGGKLEPGESPTAAAVREVAEEVGVSIHEADLKPIARIAYPFVDRPEWSQFSHAFVCERWQGEPRASTELAPRWFPRDDLPLDRMWADAAHWLPRALAGEFVAATLTFGAGDAVVGADWSGAHRR
jgi:8-oxo-dGTP diphosphatase